MAAMACPDEKPGRRIALDLRGREDVEAVDHVRPDGAGDGDQDAERHHGVVGGAHEHMPQVVGRLPELALGRQAHPVGAPEQA